MIYRKNSQGEPFGFTLVELLIVVAIIAIISVIAIPHYRKYAMEAKQSDAQIQLKAIYLAEELYHSTYGTYTSDTSKLSGWKDSVGPYTFSLANVTSDTFVAIASGNLDSDSTLDIWQIDETGELTHISDDSQN